MLIILTRPVYGCRLIIAFLQYKRVKTSFKYPDFTLPTALWMLYLSSQIHIMKTTIPKNSLANHPPCRTTIISDAGKGATGNTNAQTG